MEKVNHLFFQSPLLNWSWLLCVWLFQRAWDKILSLFWDFDSPLNIFVKSIADKRNFHFSNFDFVNLYFMFAYIYIRCIFSRDMLRVCILYSLPWPALGSAMLLQTLPSKSFIRSLLCSLGVSIQFSFTGAKQKSPISLCCRLFCVQSFQHFQYIFYRLLLFDIQNENLIWFYTY